MDYCPGLCVRRWRGNNDLGLAWLEQVFEGAMSTKVQQRWWLLILDGHASHITMNFIRFCNTHKTLLAVFSHATHTLQLFGVVLFAPLTALYTSQLIQYLHDFQDLTAMRKGNFFPLFWKAWMSFFTIKTKAYATPLLLKRSTERREIS
jgi:hypothetical protein